MKESLESIHRIPQREDIEGAAARIDAYVHHTPILKSKSIDHLAQADIFFKCENFQKVGAFKFRGACNALFSSTEQLIKYGVATHSSGNHAQALALAARMRGVPAFIVMPENAPQVKKLAVAGYGAEIIECASNLQSRETTLSKVIEETKAHFVHPYNDYRVIAGQATCARELVLELHDLDVVIAPVGGGGLLSGTALSAHYYSPPTEVYGAEPSGADDAYQSFVANRIIPASEPSTIADGLLTSLGDKTFPIIKKLVTNILLVEDDAIIRAMQLIWERMKIVIEPSAAVAFAAVLGNEQFRGKKIGVILSGGNVDLNHLPFRERSGYDK